MNDAASYWETAVPWRDAAAEATARDVENALACSDPGLRQLADLLSPVAASQMETLAQKALALTRRHFGRTMALYVPLYLSNHCSGGCAYCGFASDREQPRTRLNPEQIKEEAAALHGMGFEDILLLTGEETPEADADYVQNSVGRVAPCFHRISIETFAMSREQYAAIFAVGCTGVTLYQETYDPDTYQRLHRWGAKRDMAFRLEAPERALAAGVRSLGMGALLGLASPVQEALCLFMHLTALQKRYWQTEFTLSFPRLRMQTGGFQAPHPVDDRTLAQIIFALRICLPTVPLVLSTRENAAFRDGIAGIGISKMSVASRTTVGGYHQPDPHADGQFSVSDTRSLNDFCAALRRRGLHPVYKNWDATLR